MTFWVPVPGEVRALEKIYILSLPLQKRLWIQTIHGGQAQWPQKAVGSVFLASTLEPSLECFIPHAREVFCEKPGQL